MFFELENIGKIKKSCIELRGITVLAGGNGTGKSTFGKMLYCMFNAFCNSDEQIKLERKKSIRNIFERMAIVPLDAHYVSRIVDDIVGEIDEKKVVNKVKQLFEEIIQKVEKTLNPKEIINAVQNKLNDESDDILKKVQRSLSIDNDQIQKNILISYLSSIFEGQITHINNVDKQGIVSLSFRGGEFKLEVRVDVSKGVDYSSNVSIAHNAFYVDTPFILDKINSHRTYESKYRQDLLEHIHYSEKRSNAVDTEIVKQQLETVLQSITFVVPGEFKKTDFGGGLGFQENGLDKPLGLANISAGMKPFLIIKRLLETHAIREEDVLILDEPEIHLHPEWQVEFAKALVLLQKAFNLTILLTTHSPYFMRAIEVFSIKEKITDCCNYYITTNKDGFCFAEDVTKDTDDIYQILSKPFQTLDNILYEK
ncbi:MAG: ATP-binding protein [Planctomycetaceae bacterium]|jgi:predicted ATPase|nr:ATP-binding protein [Planctomycetaceae bacterium]